MIEQNLVISIQNVNKSYGRKLILQDINLNIRKSEIYGLIGPSGAGKTTLVKLLVGMEKADTGIISILDIKVPNLNLLQKIGYMSQSDALYSELTGEENLRFFASLFRLNKIDQSKRIKYTAELVNLTNELTKKVSAYSGGMKRRLSLAIALIQNPEILILDEPTVGIDPELRLSIWKELRHLKDNEGKTIIITTHVMDEAMKCDILSMVRDGHILANGSPNELIEMYNAESLEEVFIKAGER